MPLEYPQIPNTQTLPEAIVDTAAKLRVGWTTSPMAGQ